MPRYLTLTELLFNLFLFGGVGWWLGRWRGVAVGIGILLVLYGRTIVAALPPKPEKDETAE